MQTSAPASILLQLAQAHAAHLRGGRRAHRPLHAQALRRRIGTAVIRVGTWVRGGDLRPVGA